MYIHTYVHTNIHTYVHTYVCNNEVPKLLFCKILKALFQIKSS